MFAGRLAKSLCPLSQFLLTYVSLMFDVYVKKKVETGFYSVFCLVWCFVGWVLGTTCVTSPIWSAPFLAEQSPNGHPDIVAPPSVNEGVGERGAEPQKERAVVEEIKVWRQIGTDKGAYDCGRPGHEQVAP